MPELISRPSNNVLYAIEKERLSAQVLHLLKQLKRAPTKSNLAKFEDSLKPVLYSSLYRVGYSAYVQGASDVGFPLDKIRTIALSKSIDARVVQATTWIVCTTGVALDITAAMSRSRVASSARADLIAVNNLAVAHFRGTRFGWGLDSRSRKSWYVADSHDKDDLCDDNEDDGPLPIDEPFQSGDQEPPAHIECQCLMRLTRSPWPEK